MENQLPAGNYTTIYQVHPMARIQPLLKQKASDTNTPLWIVEKDYALSYLLAGISEVSLLHDLLVLKGGTALKKSYFHDYRFSEDLDFSTRSSQNTTDMRKGIEKAVQIMEKYLLERGPFRVQSEPLELREPHPRGQIAYTVRVQFPYQREPMCRLKVEITVDEPLLLSPETRPVLHDYQEPFRAQTAVYPLPEIAAEKYRALLQSLDRLQEKGWGANRVCRDYFDLWWILGQVDLLDSDIPSLTDQKCAARGIVYKHPDEFFAEALVEVANREWQNLLLPFIPQTVEIEKVISELQSFTDLLWDEA